jgi:hypothetical protein
MNKIIKKLTLIELVVALVVFLILSSIIMGIFNSINNNLTTADGERDIYERARIALDIISRDIQCAYYGEETVPFWHHSSVSNWGEYNNELLALVSTSAFPTDNYSSDLFEIKYQLYYTTDTSEDTSGWILRSITDNLTNSTTANPKWNFNNNFNVGYTTNASSPLSAFTADSTSSDLPSKLIPYVTKLSFRCYNEDGIELDSDIENSLLEDACNVTDFPYTVEINMSLLDRVSWNKWINAGGTPHDLENDPVSNLRRKSERSFTQSVLIGNRGQCN